MIEARKLRLHPSWVNDILKRKIENRVRTLIQIKNESLSPRFDAWKLSNADIRSICASNFERGNIVLSRLIFSTAERKAISWASSPGWNRPPSFSFKKKRKELLLNKVKMRQIVCLDPGQIHEMRRKIKSEILCTWSHIVHKNNELWTEHAIFSIKNRKSKQKSHDYLYE